MKPKKIIILEKVLRLLARTVLARRRPVIVAITGSVGKTSTKVAVSRVLSAKFEVRENQKNYNNEIGIPLTIIGAESGGKNLFKWIKVFLKWFGAISVGKYPQVLILELGVDRPGDMAYFMSFIKPNISIVTNVGTSHLEYFRTIENIAKEKGVIVESLKGNDFAILNADDDRTLEMQKRTEGKIMTFGKKDNATVSAANIIYNYDHQGPTGISFKLSFEGKTIPIRLKKILAAHQVYAALAAIAAGMAMKINLVEIAKALETLEPPTGRMNLLKGISGSFIVDDTYNASPLSTIAALEVLGELKAKRKIAVLGDMLELGTETKSGHQEIGRKIFTEKIDLLLAVGERMRFAVAELITLGWAEEKILQFDDPMEAGEQLKKLIKKEDFVLVKGSQGMRMEKVVQQILAEDQDAEKFLCRQNLEWRNKPFVKP